MGYSGFLLAWIPFWVTIIGTLLSLYQMSFLPGSRAKIVQLLDSTNLATVLASAIYISQRVPGHLFGRKLISCRSVTASLVISALVFTFSYGIAVITTPDLRGAFGDMFSLLPTRLSKELGHVLPPETRSAVEDAIEKGVIFGTSLVVLAAFCLEFIFLLKSRFFLRFIRYNGSLQRNFLVLASDLATTLVLFITLLPFPIMLLIRLNPVIMGSGRDLHFVAILDQDIHPGNGVLRAECMTAKVTRVGDGGRIVYTARDDCNVVEILPYGTPSFAADPSPIWFVPKFGLAGVMGNSYNETVSALWKDVEEEVQSGFSNFETFTYDLPAIVNARLPRQHSDGYFVGRLVYAADTQASRSMGDRYPGIVVSVISLPISTMLAGAMATSVWMILTTSTITLVRFLAGSIGSLHRWLIFLHDKPDVLIFWGVVPSCGLMIFGIVIFTLLNV